MRWIGLLGLFALVGLVAVLVVQNLDESSSAEIEPITVGEARVVVADLVETDTLSGRLRYAGDAVIRSALAGTVTAVPDEGSTLSVGDRAFEIDGAPVIVLAGDRPAWRPFIDGMDDGADVLQLEGHLVDAGHLDEADEVFDEATADAIEEWRPTVGLPEARIVELGRVVFLSADVRVAGASVDVGEPVTVGHPVLVITEPDQEVLLELDPGELDLVSVGDPVTVVLPDDRRIDGRIAEIASTVRSSGPEPSSGEVVDVIVELDSPVADVDLAPVDVEIETDRASAVLAVPVRALLALSDGGYAVERVIGDGTELVGVEIGEFADGLVEVRGALVEGDTVRIPG